MIKDKVMKLMNSDKGIDIRLNGILIPRNHLNWLSDLISMDFYREISKEKILEVMISNNYQKKEITDEITSLFWGVKRISEMYGTKPKLRTRINTYLSESIKFADENLTILFTNEFDWKPGEYGDHNSCWWQSKASAKDMLKKEGGFAIKVHSGKTKIARCWGVFFEESFSEPALLIFNSYSNMGIGNINDWMAHLITEALEYKNYYTVRLTNNNGGGQNILFINKNEGLLLSNKEHKKEPIVIDLRWKEIRTVQCTLCRAGIPEENAVMVEERHVCTNCANTKVSPCFQCTELFFTQNTQTFEQDGFNKSYCFSCFSDLFAICRYDSKIYPKSAMEIIDYGDFCAKENLKNISLNSCKTCGHYNHRRRNWCWHCGRILEKNLKDFDIKSTKNVKQKTDMSDYFVISAVKSAPYLDYGDDNE